MPKTQIPASGTVRMSAAAAEMFPSALPMVRLPAYQRPHRGWNPIGRKAYRNSGMPGSMRRAHTWAQTIFGQIKPIIEPYLGR